MIARPANPPTTPPTTAGVEGALLSPEPALELAVGDGADSVPPEPPTPPPMIAPVFDGPKDDVDELESEEDEDRVCEEVALPVLDEATKPVRLVELTDDVEEAPLVCDEPDLVEVTNVLFALVAKVFRSRTLVPENVELGLARRNLAGSSKRDETKKFAYPRW